MKRVISNFFKENKDNSNNDSSLTQWRSADIAREQEQQHYDNLRRKLNEDREKNEERQRKIDDESREARSEYYRPRKPNSGAPNEESSHAKQTGKPGPKHRM